MDATRALDHFHAPGLPSHRFYAIAAIADNKELLTDACETLTSAKVMAHEIELEEIETAAFKDRYGAKAMPAQVRTPKVATTG